MNLWGNSPNLNMILKIILIDENIKIVFLGSFLFILNISKIRLEKLTLNVETSEEVNFK